jgi:hypothetical protein
MINDEKDGTISNGKAGACQGPMNPEIHHLISVISLLS